MTKLVTWNCNMAFRKKKAQLLEYDPDVLVIQECECPALTGDWSAFADWRWIGENEHKGLAVFVRNGRSLDTPSIDRPGGRFTLPVTIDGALDVLGVWAMNDEQNPENRYIGQVHAAVRQYRDFLDDAVVAGDWNWNVQWDDSPKYRLRGDFSETVSMLEDRGLQSAYHASSDCGFGNEDDPTFFMHKQRERSYHTDYVFAPSESGDGTPKCWIGDHDVWSDASDHMPVFVEL